MARYMVLHCPYGPDVVYSGMRLWSVKADSMEEAEKAAQDWLEERNNLTLIRHDKHEYRIIEIADEVGPRVYDVKARKRL